MKRIGAMMLVMPTLWIADPARACSLCDSDRAREVRAGVFDERFGWNVAAAVLPFAVLAALIGAVHFAGGSGTPPKDGGEVRR